MKFMEISKIKMCYICWHICTSMYVLARVCTCKYVEQVVLFWSCVFIMSFPISQVSKGNSAWGHDQVCQNYTVECCYKVPSNMIRYCINVCRNSGRTSVRGWTHKRHHTPHTDRRAMGCLLWIFVRKIGHVLMALHCILFDLQYNPWNAYSSVLFHLVVIMSLFFVESCDEWPILFRVATLGNTALVQIMAWCLIIGLTQRQWSSHEGYGCHQATSHYLSQCWPALYCHMASLGHY